MKINATPQLSRREFLGKSIKTAALAVSACSGAGWISACTTKTDMAYDLALTGGMVYDGTLALPKQLDLGIKDGRIAVVGRLSGAPARTIDVRGLAVMPGIIDIHTHCDLTFSRSGWKRPLARVMPSWKGNYNYIYQGVTTVVTGNCGYGYPDADAWLDLVDSIGFGAHVYHLAPHGMIREELFGAIQPGELTAAQMETLKARVEEEMDKGAVGMSAGLEYSPGLLATTDEMIELCKVVRKKGGLFAVHMRDECGVSSGGSKKGVIGSIREVVEIARRAEIPVQISHLKINFPIGDTRASQVLEVIESARHEGLDVTADQYPYDAGSTMVSILLPERFLSSTGVKDAYKTREGRTEIKNAITRVFSYLPPEKTLITLYPEKEAYEGKNIKEIAELEGRSPADAYADLVCEENAPTGVFFSQDMRVVREIMPNDYIMTASDGWTVPKGMSRPHPRTYGTFPRKLRKFALDEGLMSLTQAIRSMTSLPAEKLNIKDRGVLKPGNMADIAVFDTKTITDKATYAAPHQYAQGIVHLLMDGAPVIENAEITGKRMGRALRRA
jgi:N-acyl-D-amino-acid deacylase